MVYESLGVEKRVFHFFRFSTSYNFRIRVDATNSKGRNALSFAAAPSIGRQASIPALEIMLEADPNLEHEN